MPQAEAYQQSLAAEFIAVKDRVRYFIGSRHWGTDGRYKEIILINYLRKILPRTVSVGTGFVKNARGELTSQIDIIVFLRDHPILFSEDDFVIVMPESVVGIIEVKSRVNLSQLANNSRSLSIIKKSHKNGAIIGNDQIFNGIFSYETISEISTNILDTTFAHQLEQFYGYLNHICFDQNYFCRYWKNGNPMDCLNEDHRKSYSFYDLSCDNVFRNENHIQGGLAYGYFISNLLETVYRFTAPDVLRTSILSFYIH